MTTLNLEAVMNIQDEDHWEMLKNLAELMNSAGEEIGKIADGMDLRKVAKSRIELAKAVSYAQVYIDITKIKLAIGNVEWKERTEGIVDDINKKYATPEKYDDMDF